MNAYKYIKQSIRENLRKNMIAWRAGDSVVKLDKPSDIGRARSLGYKDKKGIIVVRVKLVRGGRTRKTIHAKRKTKKATIKKTLKMNYQWVAESRAGRKFTNLEVLNSYKVGKDGIHYFFEVILIDPARPEIQADKQLSKLAFQRGRAFRGLTSAARKSRGLRKRSNSKVHPSLRAHSRQGK